MSRGRYRWRTRIRRHLPWFLIDRGWAAKGSADCGDHRWYNADGVVEHCYHCAAGARPHAAHPCADAGESGT